MSSDLNFVSICFSQLKKVILLQLFIYLFIYVIKNEIIKVARSHDPFWFWYSQRILIYLIKCRYLVSL